MIKLRQRVIVLIIALSCMALLCGCGKATKQLTTVELAEQESTETELRLDGQ
jgi:ABC-type uncharacterized transport system auxiliary subunit